MNIKVKAYARNYFITDEDKESYEMNPVICELCGKKVKKYEDLTDMFLYPHFMLVHRDCKDKEEEIIYFEV